MSMTRSRTKVVGDFGQSLWYDNISRGIVRGGWLAAMINDDGLGGVTSNPTIFMKAIAEGSEYDEDIRSLKRDGISDEEIVHILTVGDIREAADVLKPVYERTGGVDGYVSLECNPKLAYDAEGTVSEALSLFEEVKRPNVMIKVPGTPEGIAAVKELLFKGINVNITLLFSPENYRRVAEAYIEALEARDAAGMTLSDVHSVASFFLSRIDNVVDRRLDEMASAEGGGSKPEGLRGKAAVSVAKVTYSIFGELFFSDRYRALEEKGANIQRPLWASTSTKDPSYSDVKYVEALIGPHTVNTLPQATIDAFRDHGEAGETLTRGLDEALLVLEEIGSLGIDMNGIYDKLQADGVQAFTDSYESLVEAMRKKQG